MISLIKNKQVKEFGDFQTPRELAFEVCLLLSHLKINPQTIIEPTCGLGSFVGAARAIFHSAKILGFDVSPNYIAQTQDKFRDEENISIFEANFFETDWKESFKTSCKTDFGFGQSALGDEFAIGSFGKRQFARKKEFPKSQRFRRDDRKEQF